MSTTTTTVNLLCDVATAAAVCDSLWAYNIVVLVGERDHRLMARDIPRPGRRYTNLDSGTEWFDLVAVLHMLDDVIRIDITPDNGDTPTIEITVNR
jgi:hypothetical protein